MTNLRDQEVDTLYIQQQHLHVIEDMKMLLIPQVLVKHQENGVPSMEHDVS